MELFSGMGSEKDQLLIKTKHSKIKPFRRGPQPEQNRFCRDLRESCGRPPSGPDARPKCVPGPGRDPGVGDKGWQ